MVMLLVADRLVSMYNLVVQHIKLCWKYCRNIQAYNTSIVQQKFKHVFSNYAALNPTIAQQQSFVILLRACYMFRPQHGNPNGDFQHWNLLMSDSVKDMGM
jgi:hypothetical protein